MSKRKNQKRNSGKGSRQPDPPSKPRWKTSGENPPGPREETPEPQHLERREADSAISTESPNGPPSLAVQAVVSVAIVAHLVLIAVSFTAIIDPSETHSSLLDAAAPYLRSTHFAADGRSFYLGRDDEDEQPHRLQVASLQPGQSVTERGVEWSTIEPQGIPGFAESDRYARWMVLAATLARSDQASLAATVIGPFVQDQAAVDAVRVVRLPTLLTTDEDDRSPVAYLARIVRDGESVRLVAVQPKRLTTFERSDAP